MVRNILGLDVGDKRVGTALSDPLGTFAIPYKTFNRERGEAEKAILALVAEKSISLVVAGLPLNDDGSKNEQCLKVENFCRRLTKRAKFELIFVDEFATSSEAEAKLSMSGVSRRRAKSKGATDAVAAALILQTYIDNKSKT